MKAKLFNYVWGLAETADWERRFPRPFWRWLLRWCDARAGYTADGHLGEILAAARNSGCDTQGPANPPVES